MQTNSIVEQERSANRSRATGHLRRHAAVPHALPLDEPLRRVWAHVEAPLNEFKQLVARCDQAAIKHDAVPPELGEQILKAFAECEALLNRTLGDTSLEDQSTRDLVGGRVRAEMLPYLLLSENGERWYSKPRGYAGDFLSIAQM